MLTDVWLELDDCDPVDNEVIKLLSGFDTPEECKDFILSSVLSYARKQSVLETERLRLLFENYLSKFEGVFSEFSSSMESFKSYNFTSSTDSFEKSVLDNKDNKDNIDNKDSKVYKDIVDNSFGENVSGTVPKSFSEQFIL